MVLGVLGTPAPILLPRTLWKDLGRHGGLTPRPRPRLDQTAIALGCQGPEAGNDSQQKGGDQGTGTGDTGLARTAFPPGEHGLGQILAMQTTTQDDSQDMNGHQGQHQIAQHLMHLFQPVPAQPLEMGPTGEGKDQADAEQ